MTNQQAPEIYALHTVPNKGERPWSRIYAVRADAEHDAKVLRDATGRDWSVVRLVVADTATTPTGPVARYKIGYHTDDWGVRSSSPSGIPDPAGAWVRYEDHIAALVEAQQPAAHVQNPAEIEHVAGDVSKNGPELNMAQPPAPSEQQPFGWIKQSEIDMANNFGGSINLWRRQYNCDVPVYLAQQPAPSAASKAVLAAIRAANMQLVRTGDDEFMLVTYKNAKAQCDGGKCGIGGYCDDCPTPQADIQPVPQGETNVQLDTDSNHSAPGQQRDVAGSVALGQPVGNGSDQAAGHTGAQGDKLLIVAERNIRSFLRSAVFKSESDREAALNCVDVLWEAARALADSVTAPAAAALHQIMAAAKELHAIDNPDAEPEWAALRQCEVDVWRARAERVLKAATPRAQAAGSVLEDAARLDWQDISTAPKDGTRFVAVGNNYGLYSETQHTCIAQWFRGCWMEVSDWNEASELKYLTHWMPLPPLPGSAASATEDSVTAPAGEGVAGPGGKCMGSRCMASTENGYAHSRECIDEAGEVQGWKPTAEDYAKCGPSAPTQPTKADSVREDAARLDFLIEQRAYVVSDPDTCPGYWLHFVHKETGKCWVQCDEHPTPRAAIDAAMKAGAQHEHT